MIVSIIQIYMYCYFFFFFSSRRRHTRFDCDWSSDVCSSDLSGGPRQLELLRRALRAGDRRGRRADARRAALACGAGEALCAHARGRRQAGDRRPVFESVAGAPDLRTDGRAQRHASALGRRLSGPVRREREAPDAMIELLLWPFLAGLVLTAMHGWVGPHVLARGGIFG